MSDQERQEKFFGDIAIEKQIVTKEKLERALVIQRCIANRTKVFMPIGAVLQKMGLVTQAQVDEVLSAQNNPEAEEAADASLPGHSSPLTGLNLVVSNDKLTATIAPVGANQSPPPLDTVKLMLMENEVGFGLVSDSLLAAHLKKHPMPAEPFVVAQGTPPVAGQPPEIRYYFDTNPLRVGTLLEDGTMDWKNRGEIPQVAVGDLLAEKVGGDPGKPGTSVFGLDIAPPRIKEPALKFSKGAERSEDGRQILAKVKGTPKLGADGRVGVYGVLPIESDIGVATGNVEFDGHIEVDGCVSSGYKVRGGSLNTKEIQNAEIEMSDDLVSLGGVYGSTIKVGGFFKASHIHNSTIEVLGDLIVEKEIIGCTIEVNGRCMIDSGKIVGSKIGAKKGIHAKDVGTQAARPSELIVGVDFKFERDMKACKEELADLERRKTEAANAVTALKSQIDLMGAELGQVAQEQDGCMVQKRGLEAKLNGPEIANNPEKRSLLEELIGDLAAKYDALDNRVQAIMAMDDQVRSQITLHKNNLKESEQQITATQEHMNILEEAAKVDPGIPVVKASGIVFAKTLVAGPHRKILLPQDMHNVRIAESQEEHQMKISSLR
ncbi:MAG: flagellar assembly protein A [Desulfatitalea sp.]